MAQAAYYLPMRLIVLLASLIAGPALSQERIPSHCIALSQSAPGMEFVQLASFRAPVAAETVRITYLDHAMFLIQSEGGTAAMTDFTGYYGNVEFTPDVVTMNNAHNTHWTAFPDPAIDHALKGWGSADGPREHYLDLGDMLVRNVHTDTRGQDGRARENGNSIFVFEAAGLCIGHLGHLHHEPTDRQYAALGRMDVVMAAVDGGLTLDHETLVRVLERFRSSVVIPMHWFGRHTLDGFLADMTESGYVVEQNGETFVELSLTGLPAAGTVLVLEPELLSDAQD